MEGLIDEFDCSAAVSALLDSKAYNQTTLAAAIGVTQGRVSQMLVSQDNHARYETRYKLKTLCDECSIMTIPYEPKQTGSKADSKTRA